MAFYGKAFLAEKTKKRVHRHHRKRYTVLVVAATLLLLAAFILQLLVALSLPIIKPVYLLAVVSTRTDEIVPTSIATQLRFGVWGYCATSVLELPTLFTNNGECSNPRLGYEVDPGILALTGQTELLEIVLKGLVVVLVLHPICAALSLLALLPALFSCIHAFAICSLVWTVAAALLATVSTAADIAIVAIAMNKVGTVTTFDFEVRWGNAPWMSLVATIFLWIVVILQSITVCGCCGVSRKLWTRIDSSGNEVGTKEVKGF